MNLAQAVILGIVEGVTEFLPLSSTAHLIISSRIMGIPQTEFVKLFEVFIQSGAILAIVGLVIKQIYLDRRLLILLFASYVPTAVVGFVLYRFIKGTLFGAYEMIIFSLIGVGILFILVEVAVKAKKIKLTRSLSQMTIFHAVLIGLIQACAVLPGVSRAGSVMLIMMLMGFRRDKSALYSFFLAVPTIISASVFDMWKMKNSLSFSSQELIMLGVGWFVSFLVAYGVVRWFVNFLKKRTLMVFGWYRVIVGILLFFFSR